MLRSYLPALVFVALGAGLGFFFVFAYDWRRGALEWRDESMGRSP